MKQVKLLTALLFGGCYAKSINSHSVSFSVICAVRAVTSVQWISHSLISED